MQINEVDVKEISWVDLKTQYQSKRDKILAMVDRVFSEAEFVNGKSTDSLEQEIAKYVGVKHAICVNSGTDALMFSMRALGIGSGDEVITPPNSFVSSSTAILNIGATPVFVDVRQDQNIDPNQIEACITEKTKAIMVVHLTGRTSDMDPINAIAKKHGLHVIEDAAQAFGAQYHGRLAGSLSDAGCFSTHPLKIFNAAGDGGFVTTNNDEICHEVKLLRNHGLIDRNRAVKLGFVSRMNSIQAELLRIRLAEEIDANIAQRRKNASLYRQLLNPEFVFMPPEQENTMHTYMCLVIQVERRNELQKYLLEHSIRGAVHYPIPIHLQPVTEFMGHKVGDFPVTEKQADSIMTIPVHQYLSEEDITRVAETINNFYQK